MKKIIALIGVIVFTLSLVACGKSKSELVIGASPSPHAQILEHVKPLLEKKGITLTIREFSDYALQNTALAEGDIDANFFQHKPYLDDFNAKNKTSLVSAAKIHFEPLGIYSGKSKSINNIKKGSSIAVPNDTTNEARSLKLLEANKIIKLKEGKGLDITKKDIIENPYNIEIVELAAEQIARSLEDVDFGIINGNYALSGKVSDRIIVSESAESEAANTYANIIAVQQGKEDNIKELISILKSDEVKDWINKEFSNLVVPVK